MQRLHQYVFCNLCQFCFECSLFDKFIVIDLVNVHSKLANFSHLSLIELSPSTCILMLHLVFKKMCKGIEPICCVN